MSVHIGLDIGSSSVKALAVNAEDGSVRAAAMGEFEVLRPTAGGWELDPESLFAAACGALAQLPAEVRGEAQSLGITGQMCGLVALDHERRPVGPALPIFDDRSVGESEWLGAEFGTHLLRHAANGALPVYTLPKLLWLRANRPDQFARTDLVVLPKDYIRGRLTGEWATDPSDASGTLAFDQRAGKWDSELLGQLELSADQWPPLAASTGRAGELMPSAARLAGLTPGLPVAVGCSDMAAVILGVGAQTGEDIVMSFGTAAHVITPTAELDPDVWPVQQYSSALPGCWFRFGAVYSGAVCAQWLLGLVDSGANYGLFSQATQRPAEERVLFMPYLAGAGAPHEIPGAAGAFIGLRLGHTREDLAAAVLEGLCFELARIYEVHDPDGVRRIHVTGGGTRLGPIVQILADVLDRELFVSAAPDAAAIGAARLGAAAAGDGIENQRLSAPAVLEPQAASTESLRSARHRYEAAAAAVRGLGGSPATSPSHVS
jgi:xylulokinase